MARNLYCWLSQVKAAGVTKLKTDDVDAYLLDLIEAESRHLDELVQAGGQHRVFYPYRDTRYYTAATARYGGDLKHSRELYLDADLRELLTLTNGDGDEIPLEAVTVRPRNADEKRSIRLATAYGFSYGEYGDDPEDAIAIDGFWGFGGAWAATGETVPDGGIDDAATTITTSGAFAFEEGMALRIGTGADAEFLYVEGYDSEANTLTVERGTNGTDPAAHDAGAAFEVFKPHPTAAKQVVRLVQWRIEQDKSPLYGQTTIAGEAVNVSHESAPRDVRSAAARLRRSGRMRFI